MQRDIIGGKAPIVPAKPPAASARAGEENPRIGAAPPSPLFPPKVASDLGTEWEQIQAAFVDDPRAAVGRASDLVGRAVGAIASQFEHERGNLEQQWERGGDVSTEDLRVALQRYRSFFHRLLMI